MYEGLDKRPVVRHAKAEQLFPMEFSSVNDFLNQAASVKRNERSAIADGLSPFIDSPSTIGVPPTLLETIETMEEKYGDEALKQVGLFCLMRWLEIHAGTLEEHQNNESWPEALHTMADLSNLSTSIRTIEQIGSFGGDDDWRQMLREIVTQAVMEQMEESGCIKNMFAQWNND